MAAAVFDLNGYNRRDGNNGKEQVTRIYEVSKIYPDPKDGKIRWYDQDHDLFHTGHREKQTDIATILERKRTHLTLI